MVPFNDNEMFKNLFCNTFTSLSKPIFIFTIHCTSCVKAQSCLGRKYFTFVTAENVVFLTVPEDILFSLDTITNCIPFIAAIISAMNLEIDKMEKFTFSSEQVL